MKEETLIDNKPTVKQKYHQATLTTSAYFSKSAAANLRKDKKSDQKPAKKAPKK